MVDGGLLHLTQPGGPQDASANSGCSQLSSKGLPKVVPGGIYSLRANEVASFGGLVMGGLAMNKSTCFPDELGAERTGPGARELLQGDEGIKGITMRLISLSPSVFAGCREGRFCR